MYKEQVDMTRVPRHVAIIMDGLSLVASNALTDIKRVLNVLTTS